LSNWTRETNWREAPLTRRKLQNVA
jgi:hypothetical protein